MSIDAVALLRIPEFEPGDELDVRELDDGFLLYLSVPFGAEDDELLDALDELLGDALDDHDDDRGVFVLPDVADPDDADTYDAVLAAAGEAGRFLALEPVGPAAHVVDAGMQNMIVEAMQAMGLGSADDVQRMLSGDQDAMLLAQIRMQRAMEESMAAHAGPAADPGDDDKPGGASSA